MYIYTYVYHIDCEEHTCISIYIYKNETPRNQVQGGKLGSPPGVPGSKSGTFGGPIFGLRFQPTLGPKREAFLGAVGPQI